MNALPPSRTCAVCDRAIEETGGTRLVSARSKQVEIQEQRIVFQGVDLWSEDAKARARRACEAGFHPWFCQRCSGIELCEVCGWPMSHVPISQSIHDDGRILHLFHYGYMLMRCTNPECPRTLAASAAPTVP